MIASALLPFVATLDKVRYIVLWGVITRQLPKDEIYRLCCTDPCLARLWLDHHRLDKDLWNKVETVSAGVLVSCPCIDPTIHKYSTNIPRMGGV